VARLAVDVAVDFKDAILGKVWSCVRNLVCKPVAVLSNIILNVNGV